TRFFHMAWAAMVFKDATCCCNCAIALESVLYTLLALALSLRRMRAKAHRFQRCACSIMRAANVARAFGDRIAMQACCVATTLNEMPLRSILGRCVTC